MDYIEYVHLGKSKFDKEEFFSIRNSDFGTKPRGGYWASPTDSHKTYEDYIIDNIEDYKPTVKTIFKLKDDARLLVIKNVKQLSKLPINRKSKSYMNDMRTSAMYKVYLDFEKLAEEYDAMLVYMNKGASSQDDRLMNTVFYKLYGWDVDSLLVFNKNVIEVLEENPIVY